MAILPKNQQKSVFLISGDLAGSGRDYQNWLKIHSFKWLWCSRTIVSYIWSIRAHFGKNLKNRKKSHFWFTKKWQNFVNGRFFKKIRVRTKWLFYSKNHLSGPPKPHYICSRHHSSLHVYHTFHVWENCSKSPIFHVLHRKSLKYLSDHLINYMLKWKYKSSAF